MIKTYEGNLTLLGNSRWAGGWRNYSVAEIGGITIKGLVCDDELATYLELALSEGKKIKLTVSQRTVFGAWVLLFKYLAAYIVIGLVIAILAQDLSMGLLWLMFGWIPSLGIWGWHRNSTGNEAAILKSIHMDGKQYPL